MAEMNDMRLLGLLPPAGGGLFDLAHTGQESRLLNAYFPAYLREFNALYYFSYFKEQLTDYTTDPELLQRVKLFPRAGNAPDKLYGFWLPFVYRREMRRCAVLRVFQITGTPAAIIAKWLYGIPYVTTYGYKYAELARLLGSPVKAIALWLIERLGVYFADAVIVTTAELKEHVARWTSPYKIHLIPNGVDTELFSPGSRTPSPDGRKQIIFVGRLEKEKNLFRLMDALELVNAKIPVSLTLIGEGTLRESLELYAASKTNLPVRFLGIVPHQRLPEYLRQADVFVLPSLLEGHPKALIEAMSCGLPCVVSDRSGCRAVVEDEKTGLLCDPEDTVDIAQQVERILVDADLAVRLGVAARWHVVEHYDLRRLVERESALLKFVTEQRHGC
jgi:glycosyltransferase involved in cell wall biosynthesis